MTAVVCLACGETTKRSSDRRRLSSNVCQHVSSLWKTTISLELQKRSQLHVDVEALSLSGHVCRKCFYAYEKVLKAKAVVESSASKAVDALHPAICDQHSPVPPCSPVPACSTPVSSSTIAPDLQTPVSPIPVAPDSLPLSSSQSQQSMQLSLPVSASISSGDLPPPAKKRTRAPPVPKSITCKLQSPDVAVSYQLCIIVYMTIM